MYARGIIGVSQHHGPLHSHCNCIERGFQIVICPILPILRPRRAIGRSDGARCRREGEWGERAMCRSRLSTDGGMHCMRSPRERMR